MKKCIVTCLCVLIALSTLTLDRSVGRAISFLIIVIAEQTINPIKKCQHLDPRLLSRLSITMWQIATWHRSIGNIVLLWHIANSSTITDVNYWNNYLSTGVGRWWYYVIIWGTLLACFFSMLYLYLYGRFSCRALDLGNFPLLDARNDCAKHVKIWRKYTDYDPQKLE